MNKLTIRGLRVSGMLFALALFVVSTTVSGGPAKARNVVLIIGDAGGIGTLEAGSIYLHNKPNGLFIYSLPYIGLMDTSAADTWVTDSAAGISAIVTGQKTNNGVLSEAPDAVRGKQDGTILKTILEYAEVHGLSTGVMTNVTATDATPAGCFAHVSDRGKTAEILRQLIAPGVGDGVEVLIGSGRPSIMQAAEAAGIDVAAELQKRGYTFCSQPEEALAASGRTVGFFNTIDFDLPALVQHTISTLSKSPKGYFLMVECDVHTDRLKPGLERVAILDRIVKEVVERAGKDTLVIFTADHSFDLRLRAGKPGVPLLDGDKSASAGSPPKPFIRVDDGHTGEQVLVAASGPGAERVHGFIANSDLFGIMMAAYGWKPDQRPPQEISKR